MNENTNPAKRREWVKNAAIIFLSIMLVLTFFSNTIMNYSLPEVATEYVQSGTITEKVRGTGTITASDPYNVSISESRVISSVAVKAGDEVKKGDPLFYLEDMESTELMDAEKELNSLILAYQLAVITESMEVGTVSNIEGDRTLSLTQKQQRLQNAISTVDAAQAEYDAATLQVASVNKELGYIGNQVVDTTNEKNAVSNAQREANAAGQAVADAQAGAARASENVGIAKNNVVAKEAELASAQAEVESMQGLKDTIDNYPGLLAAKENEVNAAGDNKSKIDADLAALKDAYKQWKASNPDASPAEEKEQQDAVNAKQAESDAAEKALRALEAELESLKNADTITQAQEEYNRRGGDAGLSSLRANVAVKENELAQANQAVIDAENGVAEANKEVANRQNEQSNKTAAVTNAQQALTDKENSNDNSVNKANVSNQLLDAQDRQAKAQINLDKAKEDLAEIQKELLAEINLESQNDAIELQQEKVEKLREKSVGATIDAPVDLSLIHI